MSTNDSCSCVRSKTQKYNLTVWPLTRLVSSMVSHRIFLRPALIGVRGSYIDGWSWISRGRLLDRSRIRPGREVKTDARGLPMGRRSPHCFQRRSPEAGPSPSSAEAALVKWPLAHPGPRADTAVCGRAVPSTPTAKIVRAQRPPGKPGLRPPSEPRPHVTQTGDGAQRPKQSRNTPGHNGHWSPVRGQGDPGKRMIRPRRAYLLIENTPRHNGPRSLFTAVPRSILGRRTFPPREWPHPRRHRDIRRESARAQRPSGHEITPPHRLW